MQYQFSSTMDKFQSSAVREILKLTQGGSVISFAGGLPSEAKFPLEAVKAAFESVFKQGKGSLQYGLTEGYRPLREAIAERMAGKGMKVSADEMLLTTGSQQVIDLLSRVYLDPGDVVLVQRPTYLAALQVFQSWGAKIVSVKSDVDGMDLDDLQQKIQQYKPKLAYVIPTFSNPTGYAWSLERRLGMLKLCRDHNVLILEDDPYGELKYEDNANYPSIFSLDEHPTNSAVVYTSTFSKTVAPALRTGWAIGDARVIRSMAQAKQAADIHSSSMDQQALYFLLRDFDLDGHIVDIRQMYKSQMEMMAEMLRGLNHPGLRWQEPKGGMFFWVELPEGIDAQNLLKKAVSKGVAFVPGTSFFADSPMRNTLRLNFTHANYETMKLGIERFAAALAEEEQEMKQLASARQNG